ncbi:His-Xaa-Ser system radical SAM maturase HxsC [Anaeromicropila herbilytica]|uniref:His-Xaa-Ser system radical SAM maturase HxsC n=1 Tax=Anaeromicropila herbilytica TaxID=2785025 RepID=A0A7R7ELR1_9FIRM|nr:His-Xaa-Ser system radical SAM maturase HxsC [Anaeromicropila herbilytica]BCN31079.1 His-Xaa-Ser system radical SAM maturase HxsC [Anaeromicropila herbilytica]
MIITFEEYECGVMVTSFAKSMKVHERLCKEEKPHIYWIENQFFMWPQNILLKISEKDNINLLSCHDFDVFEISSDGKAYLYYSNETVDNAIVVTMKCNSNCIMCPLPESVRRQGGNISVDNILNAIELMPCNARHLTVTGGEPFLIGTKLFLILNALKSKCQNTRILLLTNARALSYDPFLEQFLHSIPPKIVLGIPLHGYNANTHDNITNASGSFLETTIALKKLLKKEVPVELRIVVSKLNAQFISKIADLIIKEFSSVFCVKIMGLEMLGNAAKNESDVWISYIEAFKASKEAILNLIKNGIDVGLYNFPLCSVDQKFHMLCMKSITDYKVRFTEECTECTLRDACGGVFAGTIRMAKNDLKAWR